MSDRYRQFLAQKLVAAPPVGIEPPASLPQALKPFQRDIVVWALRRGRAAIFAGTGLGKTLQQLSWGRAVADHAGRRVLILTPLAVAQQTVAEAGKFGIASVAYARDASEIASDIVVTNYDRVGKFDLSEFAGIVLDESSIIKAHDSKTRIALIELCRDIPYRLCCTATPAPNDFVELGNHSEFLGVLTHKEMLATWFVHDGSGKATNVSNKGSKPVAEWRLKGHAQRDFWRWLSTWAVVIRHPRDLGYDEPGYDLPPLNKHQITVPVEYAPSMETGLLLPLQASSLQERLGARRDSIDVRVAAAARVVNAAPDRPWLVWCQLNDEAEALRRAIPDAVEVRGSDTAADKTSRLLGFADGTHRVLLSKPAIAGWGMNFQRCADMVFVGLNDSFEQLFQAIRRCWRFGQERPVNVYLIASELEGAVIANLAAKEAAADAMAEAMAEHMRDLTASSLRDGSSQPKVHGKQMEVPEWMAT